MIIDVENGLLGDSTTMHWHGHHQRGTPYMDGVPYVTQCPIFPGTTFTYRFRALNAGTHFWHSHTGKKRVIGWIFQDLEGKIMSESIREEIVPKFLIFKIDKVNAYGY